MPPVANFTTKLKPRKYYRNERCTSGCSMSPARLTEERAALVHSWFEAGQNNAAIVDLSIQNGFRLSNGSVGRHRKMHLSLVGDAAPEQPDGKLGKVNHIEFLEQMIARGARNMGPSTRVSPELALKAVDMHHKLTQGSQMDNFLMAVSSIMGGTDEDDSEYMTALEAAEARSSRDEQSQSEVVGE